MTIGDECGEAGLTDAGDDDILRSAPHLGCEMPKPNETGTGEDNPPHMNIRLHSLILAGALSAPTLFASTPSPDVLVPLSELVEPSSRIDIGAHRSQVIARIGEPPDSFSPDVWIYWSYRDSRRAANAPYQTLCIVFADDLVTQLRLTDTNATRAALAKLRRHQAALLVEVTNAKRGVAGKTLKPEKSHAEALSATEARGVATKQFLAAFRAPTARRSSFLVQVALEHNNSVEHIWLADITLTGARIGGVIANAGLHDDLPIKRRVEADLSCLRDWKYIEDGKLAGGFKTRPFPQRLTPE